MKRTFYGLLTAILLLGFTALSYAEMVVSLKQNTDVALPKITVDVNLTDGRGVAGYGLFLVYDPTVLKYVDTTQGNYLPNAFAAASYACVHIFAEALKNAAARDAHSIRDALANISELDTILGKFSFNADGDAVYEPNILIVRDGTLRLFD